MYLALPLRLSSSSSFTHSFPLTLFLPFSLSLFNYSSLSFPHLSLSCRFLFLTLLLFSISHLSVSFSLFCRCFKSVPSYFLSSSIFSSSPSLFSFPSCSFPCAFLIVSATRFFLSSRPFVGLSLVVDWLVYFLLRTTATSCWRWTQTRNISSPSGLGTTRRCSARWR